MLAGMAALIIAVGVGIGVTVSRSIGGALLEKLSDSCAEICTQLLNENTCVAGDSSSPSTTTPSSVATSNVTEGSVGQGNGTAAAAPEPVGKTDAGTPQVLREYFSQGAVCPPGTQLLSYRLILLAWLSDALCLALCSSFKTNKKTGSCCFT